ncbi:MAG: hypothetical protein ACJ8AU_10765 [Gemmatimonadales bacterium]
MSTLTRSSIVLAAAVGLTTAAAAIAPILGRADAAEKLEGPAVAVGNGTARLFVERGPHGEPRVLGISLTAAALTGLATRMNSTSRCFDKNGDGLHAHGECMGDYQVDLALPDGAEELELPVRWAMLNWNPEGHMQPAPPVWSAPHFDFHFYIAEPAVIAGIRAGPCAELIHCQDSARAVRPLPAGHVPDGYIDVGAAVQSMGNHLVDSQDPELADPSRGFSRTFIYGTYDGQLAFLEPMVSLAYLTARPDVCTSLRVPQAVAVAGYYPTSYCVRHDAASSTYRVTLEGMVYRQAA